ncbi:MAG: 2-amino-4-hydroxy-6-hydroxymethyldihydropteridine diphosphokinase [Methylocapsa sp.]|nr:2-amino-4-hydroxy-6-hydroxymethyldihydropteridine diphosphokinase [Methylocapsa sp.]
MQSPTEELGGTGPLSKAGIGLGSNIGDKPGNIRRALVLLEERGLLHLTAVSGTYRTPPWGYEEQEDFANACALGETRLSPLELLDATKAIEEDMGRERTFRWGPRLIDIDILFYGKETFDHPKLHLPHRELFLRAFVLIPLAEIAPSLEIAGRSVSQAAAGLKSQSIRKWK